MSAREARLALVTLAIVVVVGAWTLVIEPLTAQWRDLDERASVLEQAVARDRAQRERLRPLGEERAAVTQALQPPAGEGAIPWFLSYVRDESRAAGLDPTSLRYLNAEPLRPPRAASGEEAPATFAELRFELRARTSLEALQRFLVRLAQGERPVRVVALGVNPMLTGEGLEASLSLVALAPTSILDDAGGGR